MLTKDFTSARLTSRAGVTGPYEARVGRSRLRARALSAIKALPFVILASVLGCAPSETQIAAEHARPSLDLVALHSENIAPNTQLDGPQKATIAGLCGDVGADISIRLHEYFFASGVFSLLICPALAIGCGLLVAMVYWKILAPKRRVGVLYFLLCVVGGWVVAASVAMVAHRYYVEPKLARGVASHRTILQLAQETWIPRSTNESLQDFTANCSDRLEDIAAGAQNGDKALARYPTLFRSAEELPNPSTNPALYWAVIQTRAKDMGELFAVDSGFGKTRRVASSWSEVMDVNSRFRLVTDRHGGWLIHSDLHPAGSLILLIGTLLIAWVSLLRLSRNVRQQTIKDIEGKVA